MTIGTSPRSSLEFQNSDGIPQLIRRVMRESEFAGYIRKAIQFWVYVTISGASIQKQCFKLN